MQKLGFVVNGVLLSGVLTYLFLVGGEGAASPIVSKGGGDELADLEASVATDPTPQSAAELASRYLERDQPGLAQAALDTLPAATQSDVRLSHVRSRVALAQGQVDDALTIAAAAMVTCEATPADCPDWLYAKTIHQTHVLSAMKTAGIQDPTADRAHSGAVLVSAVRDVRLSPGL